MNIPDKIIVHHSGGTDANPLADTSHHTFEMVDALHKSFGWGGCGYHYFIEKDGRIRQGRDDKEEGAHTKGQNKTSIGICLAGNFDATLPTPEQTASLKTLLKQKVNNHLIDPENIYPHRHFATKTCYGNKLSDSWARDLVKEPVVVNSDESLRLRLQIKILQLKLEIQKLLGF